MHTVLPRDVLKIDNNISKTFQQKMGIKPLARLRWVFKFANKPDKIGFWNATGNKIEDSAAFVSKQGIVSAQIQAEVIGEWVTKTMFDCPGVDYVSASWIAATSAGTGLNLPEKITLIPTIIGLRFLTRKNKVSCFVNGTMTFEPLTEKDKNFKYREHRI